MSGSGGSQKTSTELPKWMQPFQRNILDTATGLANRPYEAYTGNRQADFTGDQNTAMDMVRQRATAGSPTLQAGNSMLTKTLNGDFLNANPYFDRTVQHASDRVADAYSRGTAAQNDSAFARANALGTSGYGEQTYRNQQALGDTLGNLSDSMYSQNYSNERDNMLRAAGLAPGYAASDYNDAQALGAVGQMQQQHAQQGLDNNYNQFLEQQNWPVQNLGLLEDALRAAGGGTGVSRSSGGGASGGAQGALGGALSGAGVGNMIVPGGWGAGIGAGVGLLGSLF